MSIFKKCKVENCENNARCKSGQYEGFCNKHYLQIWRYGKIMDEQWKKEEKERLNRKCKVENCKNTKIKARGYCGKHLCQIYEYSKILERTRSDPNEIIDCGEYYEICLYNHKNKEIARTKIDKEDLEKIKSYKWHLNGEGYAISGKERLFLHHLIFGRPPKGYEVDHHDTNPLNNRKNNLRLATRQQNSMNRKVKGYFWHKDYKKWEAKIMIDNKIIPLGYFDKEQDAIKARREAEIKYFGKFAYKDNN